MTYKELYQLATYQLENNEITLGEYEKMIEPLNQEIREWIPIEKELPKDTTNVLITHRSGVTVGWYNGVYWEKGAATKHRGVKTVTAWMLLPDRYEGEKS